MSMFGKKKGVKDIQVKKIGGISRLIKCYVCSQHFETQGQFDVHLKQHQNKLNKTHIDEIQRKTQESFAKKKNVLTMNKTQTIVASNQEKYQRQIKPNVGKYPKEEQQEEKEEREIEDALRESQILLQKIEFMTQITPLQSTKERSNNDIDDPQTFKKTIQGERQLYSQVQSSTANANIQKMILSTQFEARYFQNYQQQLLHLRILAQAAANASTINKIMDIRRKICRDVIEELKQLFQSNEKDMKPLKKVDIPIAKENYGEIKYCVECCSVIGLEEYYQLECSHVYHIDCWTGYCCS